MTYCFLMMVVWSPALAFALWLPTRLPGFEPMSLIYLMLPPPDLTLLRMMPASFYLRALLPTKLGLEMKALFAVVNAALDIN